MRIRNVRSLWFFSWLIAAVAIFAVACIIGPDGAGMTFWYRVMWIEVLNLIFWFGNINWFSDNSESTDMAITPAVAVTVSIYCITSFLLILGFYSSEVYSGINKSHLIAQVVLFAVCALLYMRIQLAAHFADQDMVISSDAALSPLDLARKIQDIENDFSAPVNKKLKTLREKISYSIQNTNKVRTNAEYKKLVNAILRNIERQDFTSDNINTLLKDIKNITNQLKQER